MHRSSWRPFSFVVAALFTLLTAALLTGAPWAVDSWPWPEPRITFIFLASITAAVAGAWFAVALADEPAALAGVKVWRPAPVAVAAVRGRLGFTQAQSACASACRWRRCGTGSAVTATPRAWHWCC